MFGTLKTFYHPVRRKFMRENPGHCKLLQDITFVNYFQSLCEVFHPSEFSDFLTKDMYNIKKNI